MTNVRYCDRTALKKQKKTKTETKNKNRNKNGETYGANGGVYTFGYKRVFQTRLTAFIATSITIANRGP